MAERGAEAPGAAGLGASLSGRPATTATTCEQAEQAESKLRSGCDPGIGKATQFQPGQSGNPGGRPKKAITTAYTELADTPVPGDRKGRTYAQLLAQAQFDAAIKGKTDAAREIADRIEGKPTQAISGPDSSPLAFDITVNFVDGEKNQ